MATSLEQAFVEAGFKPLKPRKPRERKVQKCRKCGAPMEYIEGTNVMVCTGEFDVKGDDGAMKSVSCNNRFIFSVKE